MTIVETSFLIASERPENLAGFYSLLLDGQVEQGFDNDHYLLKQNQIIKIEIFRPSSKAVVKKAFRSSCFLCFKKQPSTNPSDSLSRWLKEIILFGAKLVEEPRHKDFGSEALLSDPDGNTFLILVPFSESIFVGN